MAMDASDRFLGRRPHDFTDKAVLTRTVSGARSDQMRYTITYDQSFDLSMLIKRAVGTDNLDRIDPVIPRVYTRFPLKGTGVRSVECWVEPYFDDEASESKQTVLHRVKAGCTPCNIRDLAAFLLDQPNVVEKWYWVFVIGEDSRWTPSDGKVFLPYACVSGARRYLGLSTLRDLPHQLLSHCGVLVCSEDGT